MQGATAGKPGTTLDIPHVWDRTLRPYLDASWAAFENATELRDDAALLLRGGRHARALALAVTGLEEAGKSIALYFVGLGVVPPDKRSPVLQAIRSDHKIKQAGALPLRLLGTVLPWAQRIAGDVQPPRDMDVVRSIGDIEKALHEMVPSFVEKAQRLVAETGMEAELPSLEREALDIGKGSLEFRRQAALYTDIRGGRIQSPQQVSRREASEVVRELRITLRGLRVLARAAKLPDKGVDGVILSMQMHDRLWGRSAVQQSEHPDTKEPALPGPPNLD